MEISRKFIWNIRISLGVSKAHEGLRGWTLIELSMQFKDRHYNEEITLC